MSAIQGTYSNLQYIKSRKVWVVGIEVPEENIAQVTSILGFPKQGEAQWVAIARLNLEPAPIEEKTEGERLRIRSVLIAKEPLFLKFAHDLSNYESLPEEVIYEHCDIKSRAELVTNIEAQNKFKKLLESFEAWKLKHQYKDNLDRF